LKESGEGKRTKNEKGTRKKKKKREKERERTCSLWLGERRTKWNGMVGDWEWGDCGGFVFFQEREK
jgi:hypothetical protein